MAKNETAAEVATEENVKKSIVPTGWKSKNDELKNFIDEQCTVDGNFEYAYFFDLCRKNDVPEDKVAHYESLVADKANNHGIEGRAKMTLRNMLAARVRKAGKIVDRDGDEHEMNLPKPAPSGAAAKAQEEAVSTDESQNEQVDGNVEQDEETTE